jgi:hypothetical protein
MAVVADVTRVACNTSTGNQAITISTLGVTPKLALFYWTSATANGTNTAVIHSGFGAADASTQKVCCSRVNDAKTAEQADRRGASDECIQILNAANNNVNGEANWVSFTANTVTINWGKAPSVAFLLDVVLIGGDDFSVAVGEFASHTTIGQSTVVSGLSFKPDALFCFSNRANFADSGTSVNAALSLGFSTRNTADDSGDQNRSVNWYVDDGDAVGDPNQYVATNRVFKHITDTSAYTGVEITTYNSDGFDATTRDSGGVYNIGYVAMSFGGVNDFAVWEYQTPVAAPETTVTDTGPGFKPQFVMYLMTQIQTADSHISTEDAGAWGISAFSPNNEFSTASMDEDAATTTNTAERSDNNAVNLPLDDQTAAYDADFSSMQSTGPELIWRDNETDANRVWVGFAIEEDAVANAIPMAGHEYRMRR